jgi:hypothetical protein
MTTITDKIMSIFQKHESKGEALEDDLRELFDLPREKLLDGLVSSILERLAAEQEQPGLATQMYPTMDPDSDRYAGEKYRQIGEAKVTSEREEFGNLLKIYTTHEENHEQEDPVHTGDCR